MASVTVDNQDLVDIQFTLSKIKAGNKIAVSRATNDALSGIRTEATKLIGGRVTLKAAVIRQRFSLKKMRVSDLNAAITCQGEPVPLINYAATKVKKGVSVKILKATKKKTVKHAFIATMKSGHKGVFWRTWDDFRVKPKPNFPYGVLAASQKNKKYRLPIHELYGPRVPDFFDDPEIMKPVLANASTRLQDRLKHHTNRLIESAR